MSTVSRKLDKDNDIFMDNTGNIALIHDADQVIQAIRTRLLFFLKEYFLDETVGFPWFELVLKKNVNTSNIESRIKLEITNTEGFTRLTYFKMDFNKSNRAISVVFRGIINEEETATLSIEVPSNG